ncbi:hypothetical protein CS8_041920 [Cupriavidus sp. 8B]
MVGKVRGLAYRSFRQEQWADGGDKLLALEQMRRTSGPISVPNGDKCVHSGLACVYMADPRMHMELDLRVRRVEIV